MGKHSKKCGKPLAGGGRCRKNKGHWFGCKK